MSHAVARAVWPAARFRLSIAAARSDGSRTRDDDRTSAEVARNVARLTGAGASAVAAIAIHAIAGIAAITCAACLTLMPHDAAAVRRRREICIVRKIERDGEIGVREVAAVVGGAEQAGRADASGGALQVAVAVLRREATDETKKDRIERCESQHRGQNLVTPSMCNDALVRLPRARQPSTATTPPTTTSAPPTPMSTGPAVPSARPLLSLAGSNMPRD